MGEMRDISGEGHGFPPSGVIAETEGVLTSAEGRKSCDGLVFIGVDVQVASFGTDVDMFVVSQGTNGITQLLRLQVGGLARGRAFAGFHATPSGSFFELDAGL
jgi:hypothetical protein